MAASKDIYEADIYGANIYAAGIFRGLGVTVAVARAALGKMSVFPRSIGFLHPVNPRADGLLQYPQPRAEGAKQVIN